MCGIVGAIVAGSKSVRRRRWSKGLRVLEYRGYDSSAGVAVARRWRVGDGPAQGGAGRLSEVAISRTGPLNGARASASGTPAGPRTAPPTDENAHPHTDGSGSGLALVHNGIIENYLELRERARFAEGVEFHSETDTEVLAHLIGRELSESGAILARPCGAALRIGWRATTRSPCIATTGARTSEPSSCAPGRGRPSAWRSRRRRGLLASDVLALLPTPAT